MTSSVRRSPRARILFAKEFIRTGSAKAAYLAIGPSNGNDETIRKEAGRYLRKPATQRIIARMREKSFRDISISVQELAAENAAIVRFDPARLYDEHRRLLPWDEIAPEDRRCINEIKIDETIDQTGLVNRTVTIKRQDRGPALDRLAKMAGAYARDNAQKAAIDAATAAAAAMDSRDLLMVAQRLAFVLNEGIRAAQGKPVITQPAIEHKP